METVRLKDMFPMWWGNEYYR